MTTKDGGAGPDPRYMPRTLADALGYLVEELGETAAAMRGRATQVAELDED